MKSIANIPDNGKKRLIIVGGGFAGLKLALKLRKSNFQVVLIDKHNYHQFQPLFYQVATSGLEPSAISFPLRKVFQKQKDIHFRIATVEYVDTKQKTIYTDLGLLAYDYLVLAMGGNTNFFGNESIEKHAIPMKSLTEAINLRNTILENFEEALNEVDQQKQESLLNIVIVGGGPTGVELAGALAEMKKYILPKDYPELDFSRMHIHLLEAGEKILNGYSEASSVKAKEYLERLDVKVQLNALVKNYDGKEVELGDGSSISTDSLIWAAGIKANNIEGFPEEVIGRGGRMIVDEYNHLKNHEDIYVIGDMAIMATKDAPKGHPQVAQVAIQQANMLGKNLLRLESGKPMQAFKYKDKGSLATVGRNLAVADLPGFSFQGFFAWILWLFVHLIAILGVKNRVLVFVNWAWSYFTYDQSLRLLINPKKKKRALPQKTI
ncbi:MAG: NADH dehydrogenase [Saprospiraceae bacterium]|nr:MAG: NADH dehydrogenase [Saprospiraceae bacterium]